jgi:hypothetical protein
MLWERIVDKRSCEGHWGTPVSDAEALAPLFPVPPEVPVPLFPLWPDAPVPLFPLWPEAPAPLLPV